MEIKYCGYCERKLESDFYIYYSSTCKKYFYFCKHCIEKMQAEFVESINKQIEKFLSDPKENIISVSFNVYEPVIEEDTEFPERMYIVEADIGFVCKMIDSNELILASVNGYAYPEYRKQEFALSIFDKVSL